MLVVGGKTGTAPGTTTLTLDDAVGPVAREAALAELELIRAELEVKRAEEDLKSAKSIRFWGAITALVGVGGLIIAAIALRKR